VTAAKLINFCPFGRTEYNSNGRAKKSSDQCVLPNVHIYHVQYSRQLDFLCVAKMGYQRGS